MLWWSASGCADGGEEKWLVLRETQEKEKPKLGDWLNDICTMGLHL